MAMKAIKLLAPMGFGYKKSLRFKWEWRISYETYVGDGRWIVANKLFESRDEARAFKRGVSLIGKRNFKLSRRLVQTSWEDYSDSYGWNAGRPR